MNNALKFNGTSSYVEVSMDSPTNNGGKITIEFWNKVEKDEKQNSFAFAFKTDDTEAKRVSCHAPWDNGNLYWDCGNWQDKGRLSYDYSKYLGQWTHIALVSGDGFMGIYLNGELVTSSSNMKGPTYTLKGLVLGAGWNAAQQPGAFNFHKGTMDEFRVWNRVLTQDEIKRNMNAEMIGDEPGLISCFNFNWGIANTEVSWLKGDPWKNLPNSVGGAADGNLIGFAETDYVESQVTKVAPVGPVFRLSKNGAGFFTGSYTEKAKMIEQGWVEDTAPAFYAHRAPAPGTTPLYRLRNTTTNEYLITASRRERETLDPRKHKYETPGIWEYDGEIAFVSATQNGDAVPLYKDTPGYNASVSQPANGIREPLCYVLPSIEKKFLPSAISFDSQELSHQLWYLLVCRSSDETKGLMLTETNQVEYSAIPKSGDYTRFQWRLDGDRIVNRSNQSLSLSASSGSGSSVTAIGKDDISGRGWGFNPVQNRGTDCFYIVQMNKTLSCDGNRVSAKNLSDSGTNEQWTLLATGLQEGFTIPGPPASHSGRPWSKYLAATYKTISVNILGTGTASDWGMLRTKLVVENMLCALKVNIRPLHDVEVLVITKDDSNEELDEASCLGYLHTEKQIEETRGGAHDHLCYVTEEMMWKDTVFHSGNNGVCFRRFDQLVHEFGHVIHKKTEIAENNTPIGETPTGIAADLIATVNRVKAVQKTIKKSELYAISVQSWFDSIPTTNDRYYPSTRTELKLVDPDRYNFLSNHFDEANTWMPPMEVRETPELS